MNHSVFTLEHDIHFSESASEHLVHYIVYGVVLNVICALGIMGNALVVLVLSQPQMRSSFNCLLVGLAGCDVVIILTTVLLYGLVALYPNTGALPYYFYHMYPRLAPYAYSLSSVAQTMSVYLSVIISMERWVAVCHPLHAKSQCTTSRARWYIFGTVVFAFVYNGHKFFGLEIEAKGEPPLYYLRANKNFYVELYITVYDYWIKLVVMFIVPFAVLVVLNACIVRQVRCAQANRAQMTRAQCHELDLTTVMLADVLVFSLCNLPWSIFSVFDVPLSYNGELHVVMSDLLVTINSGINLIIYVSFGRKFRRIFVMILSEYIRMIITEPKFLPPRKNNFSVTYLSSV